MCAQLLSYKDGDNGPDPDNVEVFMNQCEAGCYVTAYEDFAYLRGFEPKSEQKPNVDCESAWKKTQALDYDFFANEAFKYEGKLPPQNELPPWLQDELQSVSSDTQAIEDDNLLMILEQCKVCDPGAAISGYSVVFGNDRALAPVSSLEEPTEAPSPNASDIPGAVAPVAVPDLKPAVSPATGVVEVPPQPEPEVEVVAPPAPSHAFKVGSSLILLISYLLNM
jgi:hypothetical protein